MIVSLSNVFHYALFFVAVFHVLTVLFPFCSIIYHVVLHAMISTSTPIFHAFLSLNCSHCHCLWLVLLHSCRLCSISIYSPIHLFPCSTYSNNSHRFVLLSCCCFCVLDLPYYSIAFLPPTAGKRLSVGVMLMSFVFFSASPSLPQSFHPVSAHHYYLHVFVHH